MNPITLDSLKAIVSTPGISSPIKLMCDTLIEHYPHFVPVWVVGYVANDTDYTITAFNLQPTFIHNSVGGYTDPWQLNVVPSPALVKQCNKYGTGAVRCQSASNLFTRVSGFHVVDTKYCFDWIVSACVQARVDTPVVTTPAVTTPALATTPVVATAIGIYNGTNDFDDTNDSDGIESTESTESTDDIIARVGRLKITIESVCKQRDDLLEEAQILNTPIDAMVRLRKKLIAELHARIDHLA